jgi:hypothetical protein
MSEETRMPARRQPAKRPGRKAAAAADPAALAAQIRKARRAVEALKAAGDDFPALARNCERILASLQMLALNIEDLVTFGLAGRGAAAARRPKRREKGP